MTPLLIFRNAFGQPPRASKRSRQAYWQPSRTPRAPEMLQKAIWSHQRPSTPVGSVQHVTSSLQCVSRQRQVIFIKKHKTIHKQTQHTQIQCADNTHNTQIHWRRYSRWFHTERLTVKCSRAFFESFHHAFSRKDKREHPDWSPPYACTAWPSSHSRPKLTVLIHHCPILTYKWPSALPKSKLGVQTQWSMPINVTTPYLKTVRLSLCLDCTHKHIDLLGWGQLLLSKRIIYIRFEHFALRACSSHAPKHWLRNPSKYSVFHFSLFCESFYIG